MTHTTPTKAVDYLRGINSLHENHDPNVTTNTYGEKYVLEVMEAFANIRVMEAINQERAMTKGSY